MKNEQPKSRNPLVIVLGNKRWQFITIPLFAIVCSLLAISVIILLVGKNPLVAFQSLLQGSGFLPKENYSAYKGMLTDFMDTLDALTPMLFAALAVAVAFKAGLFNIGVSGQMLLSGFMATVLVGYSTLPAGLAKPLVLLVGIVSGAFAGGLIGVLKYRFNINEVVSAIMLNYIFQYIISFFINTRFVDPVSRQSRNVSEAARLTLMNVEVGAYKMRLPICILLALLLAVALQVFLSKTKQGYELKAVGLNPLASKYAGIKVGGNMVFALTLSGALAGLAGVTYYLGYFQSIQPGTLSSLGFDSIAVSLLGNSHPIGIVFSSLLITAISRGSTYMSSTVGVRQEIASLVTGMILLFSACSGYIRYVVNRSGGHKNKKGGKQA
ncbi:MAG: ABC transporter permease [Oscillospiraceae bacterium]